MFPAHAGMIPLPTRSPQSANSVPRTRGDDPIEVLVVIAKPACSPHTRGWSSSQDVRRLRDAVFPAYAVISLMTCVL